MIQRQLRLARSHFLQAFVFTFQDFQVCIHPTCPKRWFLRAHFLLIFDPAAPGHKHSKKSGTHPVKLRPGKHCCTGHWVKGDTRRFPEWLHHVTLFYIVIKVLRSGARRPIETTNSEFAASFGGFVRMSLSRFAWIKWPWKSRCAWPVAEAVCFRRMRLQLLEVWNVKFKSGLQQALQKLRVDTGWQTTPPKRKRQRFLSRRVVTWIHRSWLRIHILTARFCQQRARFFRINLESKGWGGSTTNTVKKSGPRFCHCFFRCGMGDGQESMICKDPRENKFLSSLQVFLLAFFETHFFGWSIIGLKEDLGGGEHWRWR